VRRMFLYALPLLAGGCAIAPRPPSPDPIQGGIRAEGKLDGAGPAQAAFCVSPAVRPVPGVWPAIEPGYAVTLRRAEGGATWVRQVGGADPATAAAIAERLDRALAECSSVVGGRT
jgi:hypothetical protein